MTRRSPWWPVIAAALLLAALPARSQTVQPIPARTCYATYVYFAAWTLRCSARESAQAYVDAHNAQPLQPPYQCGSGGNAAYPVTYPGVVVRAEEGAPSFSWRPQQCGPSEPLYVASGPMGRETTTLPATCPENSTAVNGQCWCNAGYGPNQSATACVPPVVEDRSCKTNNPVQPGTGRKRLEETDYAGAGVHPLTLVRYYSSRWTDGAAVDGYASIPAWGGGWRHSYQARLTQDAGGSLRAFRSDGTVQGLAPLPASAGAWAAVDGQDSAAAIVDAAGQRTGYTYTARADDSVETYDASGKLLTIRQRNGWTTTLSYSDVSTPAAVAPWPGLLITVRNHFGRELRFTYDAQGRLAELLPPGAVSGQPAGGTTSPIGYGYNEVGGIGLGVFARDQLTAVRWQDGAVRRYHHDDARWPQAVTGITDEAGVRYGTYAYDEQGRVTRSELAGGTDRLEFAYGSDAAGNPTTTVTDYASGSASSRSYTFADIGGMRYPSSVSAPCSLCGNTQQQSSHDAQGRPTRTIAHDGAITFHAYNAKGQETERATFPASFNTATTRPALANATRVVSTKWHGTFNLPTQVAEPGKFTAHTYNAKGMLTGQSWTATTDATGAAKFNALKTGSTYATGWGYNANSLNTSIVTRETAQGSSTAVETGRWTAAYAANGDMTRVTDVAGGNRVGQSGSYDAHGRLLSGTEVSGRAVSMAYTLRGSLAAEAYGGAASTTHLYNAIGLRTHTTTVHGDTTEYIYDQAHRLLDIKHNGVSLSDSSLGALSTIWTIRAIVAKLSSMLIGQAHAQAALVPGRPIPGGPLAPPAPGVLSPGRFDEWTHTGAGGRSRGRDECWRSRDRECGRCDPQNPDHRGRIQAQDNPPTPYEDSVSWARCDPYTYIEAVMAVDTLMARMPPDRARTKYRTSPARMKRYFYEKSQQGGAIAGDRASFRDVGQAHARIDAEVHLGRAYVP